MKAKLIDLITIAISGVFIITIVPGTGRAKNNPPASAPDLSNHPIYVKYEFGKGKGIINIGTQPLYTPTGLISEAMKRDTILHKALSEIGKEVRFYAFLKGDDVNFFLRQDELDGGIGGDMPTLTAASTLDVVITNTVQQGFTSIVARRFMLMSELRRKRIGYAFGSNAHYSLLRALSAAGLNEKDVRLIPMDIDSMPAALHEGKIYAFSAWEPTPHISLKKNGDAVVIHRALNSGHLYFLKAFSTEHHEATYYIAAAATRALRWMQSSNENLLKASSWSKEAGEELTGKTVEISAGEIAEIARKDIVGIINPLGIVKRDLEREGSLYREFEFLKALGKIPEPADWDRARNSFDMEILKEILANPKKYRFNEYDYTEEGDWHE